MFKFSCNPVSMYKQLTEKKTEPNISQQQSDGIKINQVAHMEQGEIKAESLEDRNEETKENQTSLNTQVDLTAQNNDLNDLTNTIQIGDRFFKLGDDPVVNKELKEIQIFVAREKGHG